MDARTTTLSRRRFLALAAGTTAAACLPLGGNVTAFAAPKGNGNGRLVVPGKMGTITYTQRDVPGRLGVAAAAAMGASPTMGYLGGPNFPVDPDDLGDLVALPGGWYELLEYLANLGFKQVEFAGYGQNANNPGGTATYNPTPEGRAAYLAYAQVLRGFLDDFGLEAIGNHGFIPGTWNGPGSAGGAMSDADLLRFQTELEFAAILGTPFMGTGSDPTNANNRNVEAWDLAGEKWQALNRISLDWGIHLYPHNHSPAYNFLQDGPMVEVTEHRTTGAPIAPTMVRAESGKRLMQHYLDITDPDLCKCELDVFWAHVARHQHRWRYDENGARVEDIFDPVAQVATQTHRYPLFHGKDGEETGQELGVGNGYGIVPFGTGDIDYGNFFKNMGAKGSHNTNYEQDNAPGGASDPGRSLRHTAISAGNMAALRG